MRVDRIFRRALHDIQLRAAIRRYKKKRLVPPDPFSIPIIINNRNRLTFLLRQIAALEARNYKHLIILDNASTYAPLLKYYEHCVYRVIKLPRNFGHLALWKSRALDELIADFYVYTDSDLELVYECPIDFMDRLVRGLADFPQLHKIGLSIKTDDLPDCYAQKQTAIQWEAALRGPALGREFYRANVDTTFALYRPYCSGGSHLFKPAARAEFPLTVRHLPWYNDSENLDAEEQYYVANASTSTFWTKWSGRLGGG